MASYHLSVKSVSRATGRSAPAAAAYRTATRIENERDGLVHDYTRRGGVDAAFLVVPEGAAWAEDRASLWNAAEGAEKRKDAKVAREYELALPHELGREERHQLAGEFAREVVARFGVAADVAIHEPHPEGDQRNWHAHILTTTRVVSAGGLGAKTRELDVMQTSGPVVEALRELWGHQVNRALAHAQVAERVDHQSFARQGEDLVAEQHMGPAATAMERRAERERVQASERTAERELAAPEPATRIGQHNAEVRERNRVLVMARKTLEAARERVGELERAAARGARQVLELLRGVGASIGAEQRRQEAVRREQEAERVRQAAERRALVEQAAAEARERREIEQARVWLLAQENQARQQEAEEAQERLKVVKAEQRLKAEQEQPIVRQRPRGPSMGM
jgi:hypothetical protein